MKAVWLKLYPHQLRYADVAVRAGFEMHHAEKAHLVLCKWMRPGEINTMPNPPTHNVGCGGVVINKKNEILLVKERQGYRRGLFNIPSGRADLGETIE